MSVKKLTQYEEYVCLNITTMLPFPQRTTTEK